MRALARLICLAIIGTTFAAYPASAQSLPTGCVAQQATTGNQSLRCRTGLAIVAENGATFTLHQDSSGKVDAVDLQSKALLLEAPKQHGKARFQVTTPQAIAVVMPGFSADCLETLEEIAQENAEIFQHNGGEQFAAVPCLNDSDSGMDVIRQLVLRELQGWI